MKILFETYPLLETERLYLRPLEKNDANEVYEYFSDDDVTRYFGIENFTRIEEAERVIQTFHASYEKKTAIRWGIALKETNKVIGSVGFHNFSSGNGRAEIGYEITKKQWRKGYGSEAIKRVLSYAFTEADFNRVGAVVRPENEASLLLLEKLGFEREGTLKDYQFTRGRYHDLIMLSLLQRNYS